MIANSASILLGFSFSFLPNFTPFLAVLVFFAQRQVLQRRDFVWLGASLLLALPLAVAGDYTPALRDIAQLLGAWLLYRAFGTLRRAAEPKLDPFLLGVGLLAGLAAIIGVGALEIESIETSRNLSQIFVWSSYPALFGHTVLTMGVLIAATVPKGILRAVALMLSALGILLSGSREAAIAWLVVVLILQLFVPLRTLKGRLVEAGLLGAMLVITMGVGAQYGFARLGFLIDFAPGRQSSNLLHGTELPNGDWWFARGVDTETRVTEIDGAELMSYQVTKTSPESWHRLQQVAELQPGETYTVSAWVGESSEGARPGIQGWGETSTTESFVVTAALDSGHWRASAMGKGAILGSGVVTSEDEWRRVWFSFRYEGDDSLTLWLGLAPDQREATGGWAEFAGFQLEAGDRPSEYFPGSATQGLGVAAARTPYWRAAAFALLERPLFGWGALPFHTYYLEHWSNLGRFYEVPDHTHSLPLQILYERGIVGFVGLCLLLAVFIRPALRSRDIPLMAALAAIGIANLFDYSFFHAGVIYPIAAVAGWRSVWAQHGDRTKMQTARQATVRLILASVDILAVSVAFLVSAFARSQFLESTSWLEQMEGLPAAAFYAMLLWPAAAWREGLYPGYGLTPPQELGKQVKSAIFAGLFLAVLSLFLPIGELLPRSLLLGTVLLTLFLTPIGRALAKRLLLSFGLWGRPLVVLGAGDVGRRVVRALQRSPLDGLEPVAFFDDDLTLRGERPLDLPVRGPLEEAAGFAQAHGIEHAIVAIPSLGDETTASLINSQGKVFRRMQFVPHLAGLPSEEVVASSLDGMLALEVRNGLYSRRNRFFKRGIDLTGSVFLGLLAAPLLLILYLWIRFDSKGPGFYRSERIGENGEIFQCLKFRTMHVDAEERLKELMAADPLVRQEYLRFHKLERDPRTTNLGRWLRRYSLDELPQLFNVLKGEMSLVGPRPYLVRELDDMGRYRETILRAKPGLTGYWQVTGRSNVTFHDRLQMESHYVRNWTIWWDIICLVNSLPVVFRSDGAS